MTPSAARTISSRFWIAWGFSILAITGRPLFFTSSRSLARRTKERAM
jgi:hypothetical protein